MVLGEPLVLPADALRRVRQESREEADMPARAKSTERTVSGGGRRARETALAAVAHDLTALSAALRLEVELLARLPAFATAGAMAQLLRVTTAADAVGALSADFARYARGGAPG